MKHLDELVSQATARPVAPPPTMSELQNRARRQTRRRAASTVAVVVALGVATLGVAAASTSSPSSNGSIVATPGPTESSTPETSSTSGPPEQASPSRPVLDDCTPTYAIEHTTEGSPFSSPPSPTEMFADPARGLDGPLVAVLLSPGTGDPAVQDGAGGGKVANAEVHGREANFGVFPNAYGEPPNGGATWDLANGGSGSVYSLGLTIDDLHAFVDQIDAGGTSFPDGLQSIGQATTAEVALSQCLDGGQQMITEVRGSLASRYAEMLSLVGNIPVEHFDTNDSSIAIIGTPGGIDPADRNYREASPDEWSRLLEAAPEPTTPTSTDSPETTGR